MRSSIFFSALALVAVGVGPIACTADSSDDSQVEAPVTNDGAEQEVRAQVIGERDAGKTVKVNAGASFTIGLAQPPTGYLWRLKSAGSLGSPKESLTPADSNRPGSAATKKFTWKTSASQVGQHRIELELRRPWGETTPPSKTFSVTIDVGGADAGSAPAPICGGFMGRQCGAGLFCQQPSCGRSDEAGRCLPKPQFCAQVYDPVCGCDGKTYSSSCAANAAGVSVASTGACPN